MLSVEHYTDPGCPWAYSASPALAVLRWRYGDGLRWRLRLISITSTPRHYADRSLDPARLAQRYVRFRRFGMPLSGAPRSRVVPTATACRVVAAAALESEALAERVLRALQLAWFTTTLLLDEPQGLHAALEPVPGVDADALLARADTDAARALHREHHRAARTSVHPAAVAQGKTARTDGPVRYTAPTLVLAAPDGRTAVAGGFQPLEAYDALIANLDPQLPRRAAPADPCELLDAFPDGLTTQEVFALLATDGDRTRTDAEELLVAACAHGRLDRRPCGNDAVWLARR